MCQTTLCVFIYIYKHSVYFSIFSATDNAADTQTQDFALTINDVGGPPSFDAAGGYSAAMATAAACKYHRCIPHYVHYAYL